MRGYEFRRISDAPDLVRAVYLLKKRRPAVEMSIWCGKLSEHSPDWYDSAGALHETPPFCISIVEAGSRVGYRWEDKYGSQLCEVNWLDPEPDRDSSDYEIYVEELRKMRQVNFYRGFHQPPTEEEYTALFGERKEM